jgi:PAS domain S-box-containing protein
MEPSVAHEDPPAPYVVSILEKTPNGVLVVDRQTRIRFVNPSFKKMFDCADEPLVGEAAARFVHSDCFERAIAAGGNLMVRTTIPDHELSFRVGLFPLEDHELYCGIFIDTSEEERAKQHLRDLRVETLQRAQDVITRQMKAAQEIARLLGETTAETKVVLVKLMALFGEEAG